MGKPAPGCRCWKRSTRWVIDMPHLGHSDAGCPVPRSPAGSVLSRSDVLFDDRPLPPAGDLPRASAPRHGRLRWPYVQEVCARTLRAGVSIHGDGVDRSASSECRTSSARAADPVARPRAGARGLHRWDDRRGGVVGGGRVLRTWVLWVLRTWVLRTWVVDRGRSTGCGGPAEDH